MSQDTEPEADGPAPAPRPPPPSLRSNTPSGQAPSAGTDLPPATGQAPVPPTTQKRIGVIAVSVVVGLIAGFGIGQTTRPDASDRLNELAAQLCDSLSGESRMIGAGMVGLAVDQAEELGYDGPQLGNRMQDRCPLLYSDVVNG